MQKIIDELYRPKSRTGKKIKKNEKLFNKMCERTNSGGDVTSVVV